MYRASSSNFAQRDLIHKSQIHNRPKPVKNLCSGLESSASSKTRNKRSGKPLESSPDRTGRSAPRTYSDIDRVGRAGAIRVRASHGLEDGSEDEDAWPMVGCHKQAWGGQHPPSDSQTKGVLTVHAQRRKISNPKSSPKCGTQLVPVRVFCIWPGL